MSLSNQNRVLEFHKAFGLELPTKYPSSKVCENRVKLIKEEFLELCEALCDGGTREEVAKEIADLMYVVYGAAVEWDIDLDKVFNVIHNSNMSKKDGHKDSVTGKWIKGSSYKAPILSDLV